MHNKIATKQTPPALIHKKILTAAAENPEAPFDELADKVAGATTALVERVLDEYEDPGVQSEPEGTMSQQDHQIDLDALTDQQRETLEMISEQPDATQMDIGEELGVSGATINQRLSTIDGFEWEERNSIVQEIFDDDADDSEVGDLARRNDIESRLETVEELLDSRLSELQTEMDTRFERIEADIDQRLNETNKGQTGGPFEDSELFAKVIRAIVSDDSISENEELQVIRTLHS